MKWKNVKQLLAEKFKRSVGVSRETFDKMVSEYKWSGLTKSASANQETTKGNKEKTAHSRREKSKSIAFG